MPLETLEYLIKGQREIIKYYERASRKWNEIAESEAFKEVDSLAKQLSSLQIPYFESQCGKSLGQELMVVVGVGRFYTRRGGFDEEGRNSAIRVLKAFMKSHCSVEVKGEAKRVAKMYWLDEVFET